MSQQPKAARLQRFRWTIDHSPQQPRSAHRKGRVYVAVSRGFYGDKPRGELVQPLNSVMNRFNFEAWRRG